MRIPPKFIMLIISTIGLGCMSAEEGSREPESLSSLRESWKLSTTQEISKINGKYLVALKTMQVKYTKQGDLNAALAVKGEIDKLPVIGIGGQNITASSVALTKDLKIFEATYGSGGTRIDVKKKIEAAIKNSALNAILNKDLLGDPIPYYQKYLHIKYSYKGKTYVEDYHEGTTLIVPKP